MTLPIAWAPRRVRLARRADTGLAELTIRPSAELEAPYLAKLGTELVNVQSQVGNILSLETAPSEPHGAGAYLSEVTIRLKVFGAFGEADWSAIAQGLHHKEASPEGEVEATWTITTLYPYNYVPDPFLEANPTPFMLYSNESGDWVPFFSGHLGRISQAVYPNGFTKLSFTGRGWYITAGWLPIASPIEWTADTAAHVVVEDVLGTNGTYIDSSHTHILDGGYQIAEVFQGVGRYLKDVLSYVVGRDDESGPLDWYVRTDVDGAARLWLILRGRNLTIDVPISSLKAPATFANDYESYRTLIYVRWQGGIVDAVTPGASGAVRARYFDFSTQIDNEPLARQVAQALISNLGVLQTISDGAVVVEFPKPIYLFGDPFPLHRVRAGWFVNYTGWPGGVTLHVNNQIKGLEADHVQHLLSLNMGAIEDDVSIATQYLDKQTKLLGSPVSGLIPLNIAPPLGDPYQVGSNAAGLGSSGGLGWFTEKDADIVQSTYNIDGGGDFIPTGRCPIPDKVEIGGRLVGFTFNASDSTDPDVPVAGSIKVNIYYGHNGDLPSIGTLITTIELAAAFEGRKDLDEAPATVDVITDLIPGDYLSYEVNAAYDPTVTHCSITRMIQRTGGSSRPESGGSPTISSQSASRDSATGEVTFSIETDRPCRIQIEYGKTASYGNRSKVTEVVKKATTLPVILNTPYHWRVLARDADGHLTTGADQTG